MSQILIDGLPPSEADLHYLALVNYGAYTSFRLEDGGVRGLDLHLQRLDTYAVDLFGDAVGQDRLRAIVRAALGPRRDAWIRVSLFSPDIWSRTPSAQVCPKVMTLVAPPPPPLATSMRVQVRTYGREEAHIKHTAIYGLIRARRLARQAAFDDALFADAEGLISEGSTWNIGFLRGDQVTWPQAPMLSGVTQSLIAQGLGGVGMTGVTAPVAVTALDQFDGAFLCNSATPACPILAIGEHRFATAPAVVARLQAAWSAAVPQPI
ncbi:aminotransferase class IV [Brevundimonas sp.]|uniref:aminotransferase class IV n=1 Tax=Brevundimonas sp. TaxID=1871086 RepID=UPI002AB8EF46|nr:aminotransferase class IV [Brevundimonas sp.]MDZ4363376.1 aminotransferase class IV [Brevundimonas sp.]